MTEHEHEWIYSDDGKLFAKHCQLCNRAEMVSAPELAQMVRDLQQDFGEQRAREVQLVQELAEARALLEAMPEPVYKSDNDNWICTCCEAVYPDRLRRGPFRHQDACPWRKIRAFLAKGEPHE